MSGWLGYTWPTIATGGFFFLIGVMNLIPGGRQPAPEPPEWLCEARLLHGNGATYPPPPALSYRWQAATGIMMILLGALQFVDRRYPVVLDPLFLVVMGALVVAFGLGSLAARLLPGRKDESWSERRLRRKLERRIARGTDAHFEELRSLLAQNPPASVLSPGRQLAHNILFTLGGGGLLAAGLATPR